MKAGVSLGDGREKRPVALVTGGSRGIGRAVAERLGEAGVAVAVNFRSASAEADRVVQTIKERGGRAVALQADVADPHQAAELSQRAEEALGPLQILVNNAGITRDRLLIQMSAEDWEAIWATDLAGPRSLGRSALQLMSRRGTGRIVNVSSVVGVTGNAGQANYASAKSAILGLTLAMAVEGAGHGVAVNCVTPGYIVTDATAHLTEEQQEAWYRRIPMKRSATADDVAEVIAFLCTCTTSYLTGQNIAVDGGLLASAALGGSS